MWEYPAHHFLLLFLEYLRSTQYTNFIMEGVVYVMELNELFNQFINKDLIDVGMYQKGTNPKLDIAIDMMPQINAFLQQRTSDSVNMQNTIDTLVNMMANVDI